MKELKKWTAFLLAALLLLMSGCSSAPGDTVTGILDDGAHRFAAGKPEDNYYLKNSGILLDELIEQYSGSYYTPVSVQVPPAQEDTVPPEEDPPALPQVGCWDDFLQVFLNAYTSTSQQVKFELVNGFTLDPSVDLNRMHTDLRRQDPIHASCVKQWLHSQTGNVYTIGIEYAIDVPTLIRIKEETPALVDAAAEAIDTAGKSDYEIICAVNKYLCDVSYYPPEKPYAPLTHTAYGALHNGVSVCEGYACAAKLILNKLGIRCDIQVGECTNGEGHAWNLVELDGDWYQMDVTWNDGAGRLTDYLLVDDAYMQKSRTWDYADYPPCNIMYVH